MADLYEQASKAADDWTEHCLAMQRAGRNPLTGRLHDDHSTEEHDVFDEDDGRSWGNDHLSDEDLRQIGASGRSYLDDE